MLVSLGALGVFNGQFIFDLTLVVNFSVNPKFTGAMRTKWRLIIETFSCLSG